MAAMHFVVSMKADLFIQAEQLCALLLWGWACIFVHKSTRRHECSMKTAAREQGPTASCFSNQQSSLQGWYYGS